MQDRINRTVRWALLPAIVMAALVAGVPAAQADQQETNAEMDNSTNWQAATGAGAYGAYDEAPVYQGHVFRGR
jgi:hypothetical protein